MASVQIEWADDGTLLVSVGADTWRALSVSVSADSGARTVTVEHLIDSGAPMPELEPEQERPPGFTYLSGKAC